MKQPGNERAAPVTTPELMRVLATKSVAVEATFRRMWLRDAATQLYMEALEAKDIPLRARFALLDKAIIGIVQAGNASETTHRAAAALGAPFAHLIASSVGERRPSEHAATWADKFLSQTIPPLNARGMDDLVAELRRLKHTCAQAPGYVAT